MILTLAMCYLMWAITYLGKFKICLRSFDIRTNIYSFFSAQLHPLVVPRRSDLRPEFAD